MQYKKLQVLTPEQVYWDFNGKFPYYNEPTVTRSWGSRIEVNPFPCSTMNVELLRAKVKRVEAIFPIGSILQWVVLPYELEERVNAWASSNVIWSHPQTEESDKIKNVHRLEGTVIISGKRTIVHPAMAAYLAAHEYGHHVDYWITRLMNDEQGESSTKDLFRDAYAEMRGVKSTGYGGGRWKGNIGEVIADDFRIVMCATDVDFWEHPQEHPLLVPGVTEFWNQMYDKYKFTETPIYTPDYD